MQSKPSMTSPQDHLRSIPHSRAETMAEIRRCRDSRGFTLLEVTIAATLVLLLAWLVATLSIDGMRAQKFAERQSRSAEITQDILDEMQRGLGSSVGLFGGGPIGVDAQAAGCGDAVCHEVVVRIGCCTRCCGAAAFGALARAAR